MHRKLHILIALLGCIIGDVLSCRCTWRELRSKGSLEYVKMRCAMARLVANLGGIEAQKFVRIICAISLEHVPRPELVAWALRYAADATHPKEGKTAAQVIAVVYRFARDIADEQAKLDQKVVVHG